MSYPQRRSLLRKQGGRCYYCKGFIKLWQSTLDHKHPKSKGGERGANLVCACRGCNNAKGDMTEEEFLASDYLNRKRTLQLRIGQLLIVDRVKRLLFSVPTAARCEGCGDFDVTVAKAPVMTAYAVDPQPQPWLCVECCEEWVQKWEDNWAEWRAAQVL